jgi:LPS sulfotransferase NodH
MNYVISSPSRTGSTLLCNILQSANVPIILNTHNYSFNVSNPELVTLIFSQRRDLFRSIISACAGEHMKKYHYTLDEQTQIHKPFKIDCDGGNSKFEQQYNWHKWYIKNHDITKPYATIETIYLEDFMNDYSYVYTKLNLTPQKEVNPSVKTPYNYTKLIINYEECKKKFEHLESNAVYIPPAPGDILPTV